MNTLRTNGIKATFFVKGVGIDKMGWDTWKSVVSQMYADGHTVGNHSYYHPDFKTLDLGNDETPGTAIWEVEYTQQKIEEAIGHSIQRYFRFPYLSEKWRSEIETLGYVVKGINIDSGDSGIYQNPNQWEEMANSVVSQIQNSSLDAPVVLFHSTNAVTAKALPKIIEDLGNIQYLQFLPR
jgi:peptidoglycan/xylan/chitin deacetylase (PgdA/CDA1 family)